MKARRKGDTLPFEDVYQIVIGRGLYAKTIPINDAEIEQEREPVSNDTEAHWQDVRERAAIAAMQRTLDMITHDYQSYHDIVTEGFSGKQKTFPNEIAEFSVACANALVEQLKRK